MYSTRSDKGIVSTTEKDASTAAIDILNSGGNAIDAALAASGVLSVNSQHQCGIGGDLFALIYINNKVYALNSSGYSGSKLSQYAKQEKEKPLKVFKDPRLITIPGAVDGWLAMHKKFGSKPLKIIFNRAIELANDGFSINQSLLNAINDTRKSFPENPLNAINKLGQVFKRPEIAKQLQLITNKNGRDAFYQGIFGDELVSLTNSFISQKDLQKKQYDWVTPLCYEFKGFKFWTTPPNSQAFLILEVLKKIHNEKNLFREIENVQSSVILQMIKLGQNRDEHLKNYFQILGSDTNYLCVVDQRGVGVSLVQSNAHGFGSHLILEKSGVYLHNRGLGFIKNNYEFCPRNNSRPPHTLCPLIVTKGDQLSTLLGTMGADSQPQIILQTWINNFFLKNVSESLSLPRWILSGNNKEELFPFNTWKHSTSQKFLPTLSHELNFSAKILDNFKKTNFRTLSVHNNPNIFGHCQMIVKKNKFYEGSHDPRSITGLTIGL